MGKGSTQHQHLVQTEVPKKLLEEWLALWSEHYQLDEKLVALTLAFAIYRANGRTSAWRTRRRASRTSRSSCGRTC